MSNDTFTATNDNDIFNGGDGTDTVNFSGLAVGYRIETLGDGRIQVIDIDLSNGDTGSDILSGIDVLSFADTSYALAMNAEPLGEVRIGGLIAGSDSPANVTALADGGYLVIWPSDSDDGSGQNIYAQRFNAAGLEVGNATRINTYTINDQRTPTATALADGGYVIVWPSDGQDGDVMGIYAQRFAANGSTVGGETRINTYTTNLQQHPTVAALADGGYVIAWQSMGQVDDSKDIFLQRFAADGSRSGGETLVNTYTDGWQISPSIAALSDGGYVLTWTSTEQNGIYRNIHAQRFDAGGNRIGSESLVNTHTNNDQEHPDITVLADGGYVITWESVGQNGPNKDIYAQHFDAAGNKIGAEIEINSHVGGLQESPDISPLVDGGYVIAWESAAPHAGVYTQRFDNSGNRIGGEALVNAPEHAQGDPSIAGLADGGYVLAWQSLTADGYVVYSKRFNAEGDAWGSAKLMGTALADTLNAGSGNQMLLGLAGNDILNGGDGSDTLNGGGGSDILAGGRGNDFYVLNEAGDTLIENSGEGVDTLRSNFSLSLQANFENIVLTGNAAIGAIGNGAANVITGNEASNAIRGGRGADTVQGNGGADTLDGGLDNDQLGGGDGRDIFLFRTQISGGGNVDVISDFSAVSDTLQLENAVFKRLVAGPLKVGNFIANAAGTAHDANDFIVYNTSNGDLYYDADGSGDKIAIKFAKLTGIPELDAADFSVS